GPKTTWPGRKEVYRHPEWQEDVVQLVHEPAPAGYTRLLRPVMRQGRIIPGSLPPLCEVWGLAQANLHALPDGLRTLQVTESYPVRFSAALQALRQEAGRKAIQAADMGQQQPRSGDDVAGQETG